MLFNNLSKNLSSTDDITIVGIFYINVVLIKQWMCYDSKLKGLSDELTLVLSDTKELDKVPNTK